METKNVIPVKQLCIIYDIPISFIKALFEFELVEIMTIQKIEYISISHIKEIEKMIRLHYELDINMEGMDVVYNLLKQVEYLQEEIIELSNRLEFYKGE